MKKNLLLISLFMLLVPNIWALDGDQPRLSPADFRAKQKEFIARDAGLTDDEAARFFPVYFEMQDKKKAINDNLWKIARQGENDNLTESQYRDILNKLYDGHLAVDKLEKTYISHFRKIISYKKILRVHRSEMRFSRFLIRSMRNNGGGGPH